MTTININKLNETAREYIATLDAEEHAKVLRQLDHEYQLTTQGQLDYIEKSKKSADKGQATNVTAVRKHMGVAIELLSASISAWAQAANSGKAGKKHNLIKYLDRLSADQIALITVKHSFNIMLSDSMYTRTAFKIGDEIACELQFKDFIKDAGDYGNRKMDHVLEQAKYKKDSKQYAKKATAAHLNKSGIEAIAVEMSETDKVSIGILLINMLVETGVLVFAEKGDDKFGTVKVLRPGVDLAAAIAESHGVLQLVSHVLEPMLCRPVPWSGVRDGGYFTVAKQHRVMMKRVGGTYLDELAERDLDAVHKAMNAVQSTPWAINNDVLNVVKQLFDERASGVASLPSFYDEEKPAYPEQLNGKDKSEWTDEDYTALRAWIASCDDTERDNRSAAGKRLALGATVDMACKLRDEDELYFPVQLDSRGRMYTLGSGLNPQGDDVSRGLLQFANAMSINDEQDDIYFQLHITGMYGYDKVTIADRVEWISNNMENIIRTESDPLDTVEWWGAADKPFQFLAAVIDYARFKREGFGYLSALPVQFDGSCNGLQNFSAMLKDEVGGAATNLTPGDKPSDIYQLVADVVSEMCHRDLFSSEEEVVAMAQAWIDYGITRKVCKRPVMTLAYGASKYGFTEQIFNDTVLMWRKDSSKKHLLAGVKQRPMAMYLADKIWSGVGKVVVKAAEAMAWLQDVAKQLGDAKLPVYWTTADGLPVMQFYKKQKMKRIKVTFASATIFSSIKEDTDDVDVRKQANGIAPNVIHSFDATHMRMTINRCVDEGIGSFSMIHDSYGCHVGAAWKMSQLLREAFVDMYSVNRLELFKQEAEDILGSKIESQLPEEGNLDLSLVLESDFFFS
jgi:DNA-directed RNA polymerase